MDLRRLALSSPQPTEAVLGAIAQGLAGGRLLPSLLPWPRPATPDLRSLAQAAGGQPPEALGQVYEALLARDQPARRRQGCHYTPPELAARVVSGALAPLSDRPPQVLDPAMGAGVFLLQSCRQLAQRHGLPLAEAADRLAGVDVDPLAVMVARASLWLLADRWSERLAVGDSLLDFPWLQVASELRERGFDTVVGNPPFLGGSFITGALGRSYRDRLVAEVAGGCRGNADLCAYFLLRAHELVRPGGTIGLVCTNSIAEGASRQVGLARLVAQGAHIYGAEPHLPWPGSAALHVSLLWLRRAGPQGDLPPAHLDGRRVNLIGPSLRAGEVAGGRPGRLPENRGLAFNGSKIYGQGFLLTAAEAADLLHCEPAAAAVIRPYLSGDDLHGRADRLPARQVICFSDRSLEEVEARWPRCLARVRQQVLPERERLRGRNSIGNRRAAVWWQFGSPAPALYQALAGRAQVLVKVLHSHTHVFVPVPAQYVFSHALAVVVDDDPALLAILQSSLHEQWAQAHGSSLGRAPRYTLSRTLETFPLPPRTAALRRLGAELEATWRTLTTARGEGLTVLWNHLHDPAEQSDDLWTLRRLGAAVDAAVVESYGWGERLEHDFRDTSLGPRWGPAPAAAARLQARLLELNQTRLVGYQETTAGTPAAVTTARSSS